jgi:hypothetical protein
MVQMARQEVWRLQYRGDPYLRDLSNDALLTRAGDLTSAMLVYTPEGLIALKSIEQDSSQMERFAHVFEELMIRGLSYKQDPVREALNIPKPEKVRRALKVLASRKLPEPILVKFGRRQLMAALLLEGKGRISPASYYNDPSLGRARADNEARVTTYVHRPRCPSPAIGTCNHLAGESLPWDEETARRWLRALYGDDFGHVVAYGHQSAIGEHKGARHYVLPVEGC